LAHRLFAYGTLRAPEVMAAVAGGVFEHVEARLEGYSAYRVLGEDFPALIPDPRGDTAGTLWRGLNGRALGRLDRFEGTLYQRSRVRVQTPDGRRLAWTYVLRPLYRGRLSAQLWDYGHFREGALRRYLKAGPART
jgi:gamma-glutamylcyclotransferase (GGCT)/AIG2-like uncharacterized protein YtfP